MTKAQALTERVAFEAWVSTPPIAADTSLAHPQTWPGQYRYGATQLMWEAWKQSRKHTFASVVTAPVPFKEELV